MRLRDVRYGGKIRMGSRSIEYRRAGIRDAEELARLYRDCAIHRRNCEMRLSPGGENSFERAGGMYLIFGEEEIKREIASEASLWAVLEEEGSVCGSFWLAEYNEYLKEIPKTVDEKNLVYPREIIVTADHAGEYMAGLLYYTVFESLMEAGYLYSLYDVYRTVAYETNGKKRQTNLLNRPSYINMLMLGGIYRGAGAIRKIELSGLNIWIEPQIFLFDHRKTVNLAEREIAEKGIEVYAED